MFLPVGRVALNNSENSCKMYGIYSILLADRSLCGRVTTENFKGATHMQEKVNDFLNRSKAEKNLEEQAYRYLVLKYAGLLNDESDYMEIGKAEYEREEKEGRASVKEVNGKYYVYRKLPLKVTEEEFAAVEKEIPESVLNDFKQKTVEKGKKEKNLAVTVFLVLTCVFWIGGLILALLGSFTATNVWNTYGYREYDFSFTVFLSSFIAYVPYGAVCFLFAVLCNRFKMDINLKRKK